MSEKNSHDSLGLPEDKDSYRLDNAATAALNSLTRALEASRNVTKNVVGTGQDVAKITLDFSKGLTDKGQEYFAGLGKSLIGLVRSDDEPALGDHHKEE